MRIGAPRLQEWIDSSDAIFTTVRISFGVAPAASAARMWRRVPSACKFVQAAFTAMQISSTSLSGRMPLVHGSVVNLRQASAQLASNSRSLSSAGSYQGPVCSGWPVVDILSAVRSFAILIPPEDHPLAVGVNLATTAPGLPICPGFGESSARTFRRARIARLQCWLVRRKGLASVAKRDPSEIGVQPRHKAVLYSAAS